MCRTPIPFFFTKGSSILSASHAILSKVSYAVEDVFDLLMPPETLGADEFMTFLLGPALFFLMYAAEGFLLRNFIMEPKMVALTIAVWLANRIGMVL